MKFALFSILISALLCTVSALYWKSKGLIVFNKSSENKNLTEETDDKKVEFTAFNKKNTLMLLASFFLIDVATLISVFYSATNVFSIIKVSLILLAVQLVVVTDLKLKIIPNLIVLITLIIRLGLYIAEFICNKETFKLQIKSDLIGFAFGFGFLLIVCFVSKQAIGFGDVKLFGVIGLTIGFSGTFATLFFALVASAVIGIILLITKKANKKTTLPFAPFIYIGYVVALLLRIY